MKLISTLLSPLKFSSVFRLEVVLMKQKKHDFLQSCLSAI